MARDLSRFRIPNRHQANYDEYSENHYLPPEVAAYLEMSRRRPYLVRGIVAGALIALAGMWIIWDSRRRRAAASPLPEALPFVG